MYRILTLFAASLTCCMAADLPVDYLGQAPDFMVYGDQTKGAFVTCTLDAPDRLVCDVVPEGWGSGFAMPAGKTLVRDGGKAGNLSGAKHLVLRCQAAKGMRYVVTLEESGCAAQGPLSGEAGAEGEACQSVELAGTSKIQNETIDISALLPNRNHGNQKGKHIVDVQAVGSIGLRFSSGQPAGKITITSLRVE